MLGFSMLEFINRQFAQCFLKVYWITFFDFYWKINAVDHVIQPNKARRTMREFFTETVMIFSKKSKNDSFLHTFTFTFIYSSKLEMINILLYFYRELLACAYTKYMYVIVHLSKFLIMQIMYHNNCTAKSNHGIGLNTPISGQVPNEFVVQ